MQVAIAAVFITTPIFCSPNYIKYRVVPLPSDNASNSTDQTAWTDEPPPTHYWFKHTHTHTLARARADTHTRLTALFPGLPG